MKNWLSEKIIIFMILGGTCNFAWGKDFGTVGQVFPIEEESFLEFLQRNLDGKDLSQRITRIKDVLLEKAKNPKPVERLRPAEKSRIFLLDPSLKVKNDIKDSSGKIIAKEGAIVNPLEQIKLSSGLLFLDGNNKNHLTWARKQTGTFKWILVNGSPIEVEEEEKRPIYFDQRGVYTSRFLIENIPAKVVQKGKYLEIEEFLLKDNS